MRNIRKKIEVETAVMCVYDTELKQEREMEVTFCPDIEEPQPPKNCVVIWLRTEKREEKVFMLKPTKFIEHAEIIEE